MKVDTQVRVSPRDHTVLFYESTEQLVTTVAQFAVDGLSHDETVVIVASTPHIVAFEDALAAAGVDIVAAHSDGTLLVIDAAHAMSSFLVENWPEAGRFDSEFRQFVQGLAEAGRPVRIYGEMVALLWDAGHVAAAIELEMLWNELGQHVPFSLLCAYSASSVSHNDESFQQLCHCHSVVVGADASSERTGVSRSFPGDPRSLKGARQFVVDTLRAWGLDQLGDDAAIVVSELATNAVLHARSDFTVALSLRHKVVRLSVSDSSAQFPVVHTPLPAAISGRGLVLVAALGARWGAESVDDGKEVWVELHV